MALYNVGGGSVRGGAAGREKDKGRKTSFLSSQSSLVLHQPISQQRAWEHQSVFQEDYSEGAGSPDRALLSSSPAEGKWPHSLLAMLLYKPEWSVLCSPPPSWVYNRCSTTKWGVVGHRFPPDPLRQRSTIYSISPLESNRKCVLLNVMLSSSSHFPANNILFFFSVIE